MSANERHLHVAVLKKYYLGRPLIIKGGDFMAKHSQNEVKESLKELTRIFQPKDPRKFVKEYVRKYRITGGYEDELTLIVEDELCRMNSTVV